jgi:hypothetical protein
MSRKKLRLDRREKIFCLEIQPTVCKHPSIAVERFCSGLFALPMDVSSSGGDDANRVLKLGKRT